MDQPELNFDAPPFQGHSTLAKHASYTGAVHASETRSANITALRQLWREPRTMHEIAVLSGLPITSVCSLKAEIEDELEAVDLELVNWGQGRKLTRRTRWQMREAR